MKMGYNFELLSQKYFLHKYKYHKYEMIFFFFWYLQVIFNSFKLEVPCELEFRQQKDHLVIMQVLIT